MRRWHPDDKRFLMTIVLIVLVVLLVAVLGGTGQLGYTR
jgi:hypothetical protein